MEILIRKSVKSKKQGKTQPPEHGNFQAGFLMQFNTDVLSQTVGQNTINETAVET